VPFVWAGIEFWRRIAVGDPFGTGTDSVLINNTLALTPNPNPNPNPNPKPQAPSPKPNPKPKPNPNPHPNPNPNPSQVIINDTSGNRTTAVRRVLGQDAIIAARILFGIAG
jgi:hypothetical protein